MNYNTAALPNGLRIIHLPSESPVIYLGYQIAAGTRHEGPGEDGLAHFCEHVTFKGTTHRKAALVGSTLERVGGDLNAYTRKEETCYYATVMREHVDRAVDVLTDMVFCSTYPQKEIDKEAEVICDEIDMFKDTPSDLAYDELENIIFAGHPLGHNILGVAERVRSFTTETALAFTRKYYRPDNAVFFASGNLDFDRLVRSLQRLFKRYGIDEEMARRPQISPSQAILPSTFNSDYLAILRQQYDDRLVVGNDNRMIGLDWDCTQSNIVVGGQAYDVHDNRRFALLLLTNMLAGPRMNTRLNVELREHRGLVYQVDCWQTAYSDRGLWCVYFACTEENERRCLRVVRRELDRLMQAPISEAQLRAAKKQIVGQIGLDSDNRAELAFEFGKAYLHYGKLMDMNDLCRKIEALTAEELQDVAKELFAPEKLFTLKIGKM